MQVSSTSEGASMGDNSSSQLYEGRQQLSALASSYTLLCTDVQSLHHLCIIDQAHTRLYTIQHAQIARQL